MFRMIRRAPWIAIGALGAYYLDPGNGPGRRRTLVTRVRDLAGSAAPGTFGPSSNPTGGLSVPSTDEDTASYGAVLLEEYQVSSEESSGVGAS